MEARIPTGYTGWVRIEYGAVDAPALPIENGRYVIRVSQAGVLRTSTQFETGFADDKYYCIGPNGQQSELKEADRPDDVLGMIRARKMFAIGTPGRKERTFGAFFVGPLSAYQNTSKDPTSLPMP